MTEEQMTERQREALAKIRGLEILEDGTITDVETLKDKKGSEPAEATLEGSKEEKVLKRGIEKLKKAKFKSVAKELRDIKEELEEIYRVQNEFVTSDEAKEMAKQTEKEMLELLGKKKISSDELDKLTKLSGQWAFDTKLANKFIIAIEEKRQAIEKLKEEFPEKATVKVKKSIFSRLKKRFKRSKANKEVRKLQRESKIFVGANEAKNKAYEERLHKTLLSGEDPTNFSKIDISLDEIGATITTSFGELTRINDALAKSLAETGYYDLDMLLEKDEIIKECADALDIYISKRKELKSLASIINGYVIETKEDGTLVCQVGDKLIEVNRENLHGLKDVLMAISGQYKGQKDSKQEDASEPEVEPTLEAEAPVDVPEENIEFDASEVEPAQEEQTAEPEIIAESAPKVEPAIVDPYQEEINKLQEEEARLRARKEEIKEINNVATSEQASKNNDLASEMASAFGVNASDVEVKDSGSSAKVTDGVVEAGKINDNAFNMAYTGYTVNDSINTEERKEIETQIAENQAKQKELFEARRQEKIEADKKAREERIAELNRKAKEEQQLKDREKRLNEARDFFDYFDTATTQGFNVSDLGDEEVIDLYHQIQEKTPERYFEAMNKMNEAKSTEPIVQESETTPELKTEPEIQEFDEFKDMSGFDKFNYEKTLNEEETSTNDMSSKTR